jgi:hypothetical protein
MMQHYIPEGWKPQNSQGHNAFNFIGVYTLSVLVG